MESCQNAGTRVTLMVYNIFEAVFPMRLDLKPTKHNLYLITETSTLDETLDTDPCNNQLIYLS